MINVNNEIVVFKDNEIELNVNLSTEENTVWLSLDAMSKLFDKNKSTISRHIKNIFDEGELDEQATVANFATVQVEKEREVKRNITYYNLDVIISVGYRVKSKRGIIFRQWANKVLKQYLLQGYAVNENRLRALNKTVQIQLEIIAGIAGIEADEVLRVVNEYSKALELLDKYDHQCITAPEGNKCIYWLKYDECMQLIKNMEFSASSGIFGLEKEPGKLESILSAIYQTAFGQEVYPTLEEKAANLLYFVVKDHPFNDGCKRIAAALFLYFLDKNGALFNKDGRKIISNSALVAITLMVAESKPEEKALMINLILNFLHW